MSLTRKTRIFRLIAAGLLVAPSFVSAHLTIVPAVIPIAVPENWGLTDSVGFFALVAVIFAVLVRRGLLRPNKF